MQIRYFIVTVVVNLAIAHTTRADETPDGLFATGGIYPQSLYSVDSATGSASTIGSMSDYLPGMDFREKTHTLYGIGTSLATVDLATGQSTSIGPIADLMVTMAFSPSDQLLSVNNSGSTLFTIDPSTGNTEASVPITLMSSGPPILDFIRGIDFGPDGVLYGAGFGLYKIDPTTGDATRITPPGLTIAGSQSLLFEDIDFGRDGVLRGLVGSLDSPLYTIDTHTGLGTFVGTTSPALSGLASVPEPSTLVLAAFGGLAMFLWRRRGACALAQVRQPNGR